MTADVGAARVPLAIDLFCGLGGWTEGLLAEGFDVVGFDVERHVYGGHRYPAQLVLQDVRAGWCMMFDPQRDDIGRKVLYRRGDGVIEEGVIVSFNDAYVFVRYGSEVHSKATRREDIELVVGS